MLKKLEERKLDLNSTPAAMFREPAIDASAAMSSNAPLPPPAITEEPTLVGPITYPFKDSFFFQGALQSVQDKVFADKKTPSASTAAFLWLLATKVRHVVVVVVVRGNEGCALDVFGVRAEGCAQGQCYGAL